MNYQIIKVLSIPPKELSTEAKYFIDQNATVAYSDEELFSEHLFSIYSLLEEIENDELTEIYSPKVLEELIKIKEICEKEDASYFRISSI